MASLAGSDDFPPGGRRTGTTQLLTDTNAVIYGGGGSLGRGGPYLRP